MQTLEQNRTTHFILFIPFIQSKIFIRKKKTKPKIRGNVLLNPVDAADDTLRTLGPNDHPMSIIGQWLKISAACYLRGKRKAGETYNE